MKTTFPPLLAVQKHGGMVPGIWDTIEWVRDRGIEFGYKWNESICRYPIAFAIGALNKLGVPKMTAVGIGGFYSALAMWRREKRVYRYDLDLLHEVVDTSDDLVIPIDILYQMPAQCVFIEYPDTGFDVAGFFAWIECDVERKSQELRMMHISHDGQPITNFIVHLYPGKTIGEGIDAAVDLIRRNARKENIDRVIDYYRESRKSIIESVQLLLYICAENADIEENDEQKKVYRPSQKVADKFREVRKWDVGDNIGEQIRIIKSRQSSQTSNDSTNFIGSETEDSERGSARKYKNRPHTRRAHWHHYWVGEGRKKLALKWINTMIINAGDGEVGVTVHLMRNDKKENS